MNSNGNNDDENHADYGDIDNGNVRWAQCQIW